MVTPTEEETGKEEEKRKRNREVEGDNVKATDRWGSLAPLRTSSAAFALRRPSQALSAIFKTAPSFLQGTPDKLREVPDPVRLNNAYVSSLSSREGGKRKEEREV